LRRRLKLECRPLLLDLLAEALDVFLDLGLERIPFWLQFCLCAGPCGLVGLRLLLEGVPENITALTQVSECLVGLVANIGLHLASFAFKGCQYSLHFIEAFFGPIYVEVDIALRLHCSSP
jgi:hypothetical protein